MLNNVRSIASCFVALSFAVVACGDGDSDEGGAGGGAGKGGSSGATGGSSGSSGKGGSAGSSAGKGGSAGSSGSSAGTAGSNAGTAGTAGAAGSGEGGGAGTGEAGAAGSGGSGDGGTAGSGDGGTPGDSGGEGGVPAAGGTAGEDGSGGAPEGGVGGEPAVGAGGAAAGEGGVPSVAGAGGEGGAPVVVFDTLENGGFETGAFDVPPVGWTITGTAGVATKKWGSGADVHDGEAYLNLWLGSEYTVDISQVISPIPNGTYTLRAWHYGGPYTEQYVYVSGYDQANPSATDDVDTAENAGLTELVISDIVVTSGQITVGIHSVGAAGNWSHFDGISLTLNPE